jgi:hypothetical protein
LNDRDLARLLVQEVIPDMRRRGSNLDGAVRVAARRLTELSADDAIAAVPDRCPGCGDVVVQLENGRRKEYCSDACRKRSHQRAKRARGRKDDESPKVAS